MLIIGILLGIVAAYTIYRTMFRPKLIRKAFNRLLDQAIAGELSALAEFGAVRHFIVQGGRPFDEYIVNSWDEVQLKLGPWSTQINPTRWATKLGLSEKLATATDKAAAYYLFPKLMEAAAIWTGTGISSTHIKAAVTYHQLAQQLQPNNVAAFAAQSDFDFETAHAHFQTEIFMTCRELHESASSEAGSPGDFLHLQDIIKHLQPDEPACRLGVLEPFAYPDYWNELVSRYCHVIKLSDYAGLRSRYELTVPELQMIAGEALAQHSYHLGLIALAYYNEIKPHKAGLDTVMGEIIIMICEARKDYNFGRAIDAAIQSRIKTA